MHCKYPYFHSFILICLIIAVNFQLVAQDSVFRARETKLKSYASQIMTSAEDFNKFSYSDSLLQGFMKVLNMPGSFEFKFDSLKTISRLTADDKHFRVITWAIPKTDGSYEYSGLIQINNGSRKSCKIIVLYDRSDDLTNAENLVLTPENWYGALYYKILPLQDKHSSTYTFLGWDGYNGLTKRKLIEILTFKPNGDIVFGASAFSHFPRKVKRIIFEYAANSTMSINYDYQYVNIKERNGNKVTTSRKLKHMIVFDRLSPLNPTMEGQYQFYMPETNIFDAFVFEDGKWNFVKDIDARNAPTGKRAKPRKVQYKLFADPE